MREIPAILRDLRFEVSSDFHRAAKWALAKGGRLLFGDLFQLFGHFLVALFSFLVKKKVTFLPIPFCLTSFAAR